MAEPGTRTMDQWIDSHLQLVLIAAMGLISIGSISPWATLGPFKVDGTNGDGKITLFIAIIGLVTAIASMARPTALALVALMFLSLACFGVGLYDWIHLTSVIQNTQPTIFGSASVGWGLEVVTLGGAIGAILTIRAIWSRFRLSRYQDPRPARLERAPGHPTGPARRTRHLRLRKRG
jgi:hypothetical protein